MGLALLGIGAALVLGIRCLLFFIESAKRGDAAGMALSSIGVVVLVVALGLIIWAVAVVVRELQWAM